MVGLLARVRTIVEKGSLENFSGKEDILMAVEGSEASRDECGVARGET